jgi:hypothetical protein
LFVKLPAIDARRLKMIVLAAIIAAFVRVMLQPLIPEGNSQVDPSIVVERGLLIPAFILYAVIAYIVMGFSFVMVEKRLPWTKMWKGIAYGLLFGLIWVAYLFEPIPLGEGTSFVELLAYPIADGVSVILLGALLGRFVATEQEVSNRASTRFLSALLLIPLMMLLIRLFEYVIVDIYSSFEDRTLDTIVWVVVTGLCIGTVYYFMWPGLPAETASGRAVAFGVFFFGIPITFVNFFVVLALDIDIADMALRTAMDILAVILGVLIVEKLPSRA